MNPKTIFSLSAVALVLVGCATMASDQDISALTQQVMQSSFSDKGIAKVERLTQDPMQKACSSDQPPADAVAQQIQEQALATVKPPADGRYIGNWQAGEKLAQDGKGMTWADGADVSKNGGSCYNCHQLSKTEVSFGTIGPSLYNYGKIRGVTDPNSDVSAGVVQYTWAKLWNSKSYAACSLMPRFGHNGLLNENQLRDLMALLLDPKSPINN